MAARILVVEDNPVDVDIIREVMADLPAGRYALDLADSLASAREQLAANGFAAILLDLNLPDSTGLASVEAIRTVDPATPVIVLTGVDDDELADAAIKAGAQDYMVKGVTSAHVLDRVLRYGAERQEILNELAARRRDAETAHANLERLFDSSADGMLVVDGGGLVRLVNPAAERILGRSGDEILGCPLPFATDGAGEIELPQSDGPAVFAEIATVDVVWEGERASMVTLHDITERRRQATALERQSRFLNAVLENIQDGIVACDADGRLSLFNRATREMHGLPEESLPPERWSEHYRLMQPDGVTPLSTEQVPLFRAFNGETVRDTEMVIVRTDGRKAVVTASGEAMVAEDGTRLGAVASMHDITARRESEAALRESEERYRGLYTNTPAMMHSIDVEGRIISVSNFWLQHMGYTVEDVIEHKSVEFLTEESRRHAVETVLPEFMRTGICTDVEYQFVKKNGEVIDTLLSAIAERDADGAFLRSLAVVIDVTARKRAESDLVHTNRALRTISQGNQMLVRATSEQQLLFDMSRIAVEEGGYRMAWIGFAEEDAKKTVRPIAHYGYERGYLDEVQITWADDALGRGPTGTAIRSGRTQVVADLTMDPATGPWREAASRRGYCSTIALPLNGGERAFGAMTVYAEEPNAFTATEIEILEEMAGDVAYGILALRDSAERRRAESALSERERELSTMMANLPGMAYRCRNEPGWPMEFASDGSVALTGYDPEALIGAANLAYVDLIHPDDRERVWEEVQQAVGEGRPFHVSYRVRTKDGTEKWVREHGQEVRSTELQRPYLEGIVLDVSERHRAEDARRRSEERYQRAVLAGNVGVWDWDLATDAIYVAPNLKAMIGYADEEIPNRIEDLSAHVHPEDQDRVAAATRDCIEGRTEAYEIEHRMVHKDGSHRWFLARGRAVHDGSGRAVRLSGTNTDITQRKDTEDVLRMLTQVVEQSPIMVVISDPDTIIQYVNRAFTENTGFATDEAVGQPTKMMASGETPREEYDRMWAVLNAGETWRGRFLNRRKDGALYWAETVISPVKDDRGGVTHFVAIQEDVTDRLRTEQELAQMQKMESLGNLAGGIAHDLNNMLQPILALTHLNLEEAPADSPLRENLEMVAEAGERAKHLVQHILSFSRREELKRESVDISDFVQRWMGLLRSSVPSSITIEPTIAQKVGTVDVDQAQLGAVLMNLASNAVDAMEGKVGTLTIALARTMVDDGGGAEAVLAPGDYARLTVTDTGHGIDYNVMRRIFEPFFTTKGVGEGTGLGLATCYGIVTKHGGTIRVSSEVGVGTTFDVYLPLVEPEADDGGTNDARQRQDSPTLSK